MFFNILMPIVHYINNIITNNNSVKNENNENKRICKQGKHTLPFTSINI